MCFFHGQHYIPFSLLCRHSFGSSRNLYVTSQNNVCEGGSFPFCLNSVVWRLSSSSLDLYTTMVKVRITRSEPLACVSSSSYLLPVKIPTDLLIKFNQAWWKKLSMLANLRLWQCGKPTASTPRKSGFALNTPQLVFLCTVYTPKYRNTLGMHAHAQRAAPPLLRGSELGLDDDNPRIYIQWYLIL